MATDGVSHFYAFKPPWPYETENVLVRHLEMARAYDRLGEDSRTLRDVLAKVPQGKTPGGDDLRGARAPVHSLTRDVELFLYLFPQLGEAAWFRDVWDALASAHWRVEEGRLQTMPEHMAIVLGDVVTHWQGPPGRDFPGYLYDFLRHHRKELDDFLVGDDFAPDVREARDLHLLGYASTSFFVLGRAVERALRLLGEARKVKEIETPAGRRVPWPDASFSQMNEALHRAPALAGGERLLERSAYLQVKVLIDHRNRAAHGDYSRADEPRFERMILQAFGLLRDLGGLRDALVKENGKVRPVPCVRIERE